MNKDQLDQLTQTSLKPGPQAVNMVDLLQDKTDRTLIWGYTPEKDSFHVYLQEGTIVRLVYGYRDTEPSVEAGTDFFPQTLVPAKRVYPEASDAEFCGLLQQVGAEFTFATFDPKREPKQFHGKTLEDFGKTLAEFVEPTPAAPGMR